MAETAHLRIFDISRPVKAGAPVWPGDAPCHVGWTMRRDEGSTVNVAELCMSAHTGTHADGPFHVHDEGERIGEVKLDAYVGTAVVADFRGRPSIDAEHVRRLVEELRPERLLVRTGAWTDPETFPTDFPAFEPEAARALARAGVRLVGTDAPSVDPFDSRELPAHNVFRDAGIAILENLLLDDVEDGHYELIAFPLRLTEADASPVRAVLREL